jgi:hypothetical protein
MVGAAIVVAGAGASLGRGGEQLAAAPVAHGGLLLSPGAAKAEIKKNWSVFFAGSTPVSTKVQLLENGQRFASIIRAQARSPVARQTKVVVQKVTLLSTTRAKVIYTITLAGKPALKNQIGIAVRVGGVWKVSVRSFCALLSLEGGKPPLCRSA